jgi:hypothetical protein
MDSGTRKRRTKAELEQLDNQMLQILVDDHPQSVRHMFYRMTDPNLPMNPAKSTAAGWVGGLSDMPAASLMAGALSVPAATVRRTPGRWNRFRRFYRFPARRVQKVSAAIRTMLKPMFAPVVANDRRSRADP